MTLTIWNISVEMGMFGTIDTWKAFAIKGHKNRSIRATSKHFKVYKVDNVL